MSARRNLRANQRDTEEDKSVKKQRNAIAERFPHREVFEQDFKGDCCEAETLCAKSAKSAKSVCYLENFMSRDSDHFWLDMSRSNYLTMLYYNSVPSKLDDATRQNEETLKRDPRNFNALWCRSELYLRQKRYPEVRDSLRRMEDLLGDSVQMVTAKAELGVSYPDFGPSFYQKSIGLLEEVLCELSSIEDLGQASDLVGSRTVKWTFDLLHTYNRLMNKGTIQSYWDCSTGESSPKPELLFRRIRELFKQVAASEHLQYTAEAWIELGDAYKKYEERVPEKERAESLPNGRTVDDCFEMALQLAPDDVFVLERCGRHYRQRATNIPEFVSAVGLLKRSIERDSYRDVAFHHMGLAYRSMWLEKEGHEEARIHTNKTKKFGEKESIRKLQKQRSTSLAGNHNHQISFNKRTQSTRHSGTFNSPDGPTERVSAYSSNAYSRSRSEAGVNLSYRNDEQVSVRAKPRLFEPSTPMQFCDTIPPKYPKRESEVPKHYRKPDYYDKLRSGNPIAKDRLHKDLLAARDCFQSASDIRKGTSCRYLVDLARIYVSTCELTMARKLFVQASETDFSSNDGAYLYEQWGLMAERQTEDVEEGVVEHRCVEEVVEEVKNLYREAIRFSAESRERSRIGFYRLRDIIYDQMQNNPSEMCILKKEHLLLYKTIEDAKKAQEILDNMKTEESIGLMWELVDLFYSRNRPEDSEAAFSYLALLADAGKLQDLVDPDSDLTQVIPERISWVLEISERRVRRSGGCKAQDTLSKAFEWLVTLSDGEVASEKSSKDANVVCVLAPSSETPGVERVMSLLTGVVGVKVLQGFVEDSPDLPMGTSILEGIENMVRRVRNAVVVMQMVGERMSQDESHMQHILKPLVNHPDFATKRFCRAVSGQSKAIEYDTLNVHPKWNLDEEDGRSELESSESLYLAFSLLRALFIGRNL